MRQNRRHIGRQQQAKQAIANKLLAIEQAGIPAAIPVEMCYLGWQESLTQLAALVEPEIPSE